MKRFYLILRTAPWTKPKDSKDMSFCVTEKKFRGLLFLILSRLRSISCPQHLGVEGAVCVVLYLRGNTNFHTHKRRGTA
jgi:hypothetical protein